MNLKTFSTDIVSEDLMQTMNSLGWIHNGDSELFIGHNEDNRFIGWQIVREGNLFLDKTIVVEDFSKQTLDGLLDIIEKDFISSKWNDLLKEEERCFDELSTDRLSALDDFSQNDLLSFLASWGDLEEVSEREKVSFFLLSLIDIQAEVCDKETLLLDKNFLKYEFILRAHSKNRDLFYCFRNYPEIDGQFNLIFLLLLLYQDQKLEKENFEGYSKNDWEVILNSLSYPACLISGSGELALQNLYFSKLTLFASDCLKLEDKETVETSEGIYKVSRKPLRVRGKDYDSFIFINSDSMLGGEGNLSVSSEELGIISGSIAHELNNPIAGILAALTLLKLEDDLDGEALSLIDDMEKGAKRCKKLIEIFLSFSRIDPNNQHYDPLKTSLEQSLNLLRFRMVESNLKMNVNYTEQDYFLKRINSSIASMIFYLILNEAFTLGHQQKLIDSNIDKINVEVLESQRSLKLEFSPRIKLFEQLHNSKLLLHLLSILELSMTGEGSHITIKAL